MFSIPVRKSLPVLLAMAVIGLLLPFGPVAQANHGTRSLQVEPEEQTKDPDASGEEGGVAQLTATLSSAPTADTGAINIDFELESGPNDNNGDTPTFPDKTCSIPAGQTTCSVSYDGDATGEDQWRAWIDHDGSNGTVEADPSEGPNEEEEPGTPSTGSPAPTLCRANQGEPASADCTDVVLVKWSGIREPGEVDCDDSSGPDTERELNPSGGGASSNETYTCTVFDENGDPLIDENPDEDGEQKTTIYMENEDGPNDNDDSTSYNTPDESCTTTEGDDIFEGDNNCTMEQTQSKLEDGTAPLCFWVVQGEDTEEAIGAAGAANCGSETVGENQSANGADTANDLADRTELRWEERTAASLDVETEAETLPLGDQRSLTATVYDQFGAELAGDTTVNFEFFRRSPTDRTDASSDRNTPESVDKTCNTDDGPDCTLTYSQDTRAGRDLICAWIGAAPTLSGTSRNASGTCNGEKREDPDDTADAKDTPSPVNDRIDVVETTWLNDPAATEIDCTPEFDKGQVRSRQTVTCLAKTAEPDSKVPNTEIDFELTGANDPDGGNTPATPDRSCVTNNQGECTVRIGPGKVTKQAGKTTFRAWADADYEDSTVEADRAEGRNESKAAGDTEEPDTTDVVQRVWVK